MTQQNLLNDLLASKLARRKFLTDGVGAAAAVTFLGGQLSSCSEDDKNQDGLQDPDSETGLIDLDPNLIGFKRIDPVLDETFDSIVVPEGYTATAFFSWGDPVVPEAPSWLADGTNTAEDQEKQAGQNHDGMHYFPLNGSSDHGLLVMNHEYINQNHLHPDGASAMDKDGPARPEVEVYKEQAAHGVSIIEIKKIDGIWSIINDSLYNRRIHGRTKINLSGPVAGHDRLKTLSEQEGRVVFGTYNNCSMGYTPWGTYLACEENFQGYFADRSADNPVGPYQKESREHKRYGIGKTSKYRWETAQERFDATPNSDLEHGGYVHEPNKFGWVVEIDPFDPKSTPVKRTAMGRLVRECSTLSLAGDGTFAFYMGDDTRGEYLYKFVPNEKFDSKSPDASRDALDNGKLFVAAFYEDGSGEWLLLKHGSNGLTAMNGFIDQADVLINARGAADHVGATPMDRPEWVAVNPLTQDVYVTLTNNSKRGNDDPRQAINPVNPRQANLHGHIVKLSEKHGSPAATTFNWDIFLLAGDPSAEEENLRGNIKGDIFSSPDGLYFDQQGRLWIQTDYGDDEEQNKPFGLNQMLAAHPVTKEVKRFFVGPKGCEVTGITKTPDGKTMFINVQHPGLSFPESDGKTRPRSSTILIQKKNGGVVGT